MSDDTQDEKKDLISEETFEAFPQGFKAWVEELGWKREEIVDIQAKNEVIEIEPENGGKHIDFAITRDTETAFARFERLDTGEWQKKGKLDAISFGVWEKESAG